MWYLMKKAPDHGIKMVLKKVFQQISMMNRKGSSLWRMSERRKSLKMFQ